MKDVKRILEINNQIQKIENNPELNELEKYLKLLKLKEELQQNTAPKAEPTAKTIFNWNIGLN